MYFFFWPNNMSFEIYTKKKIINFQRLKLLFEQKKKTRDMDFNDFFFLTFLMICCSLLQIGKSLMI